MQVNKCEMTTYYSNTKSMQANKDQTPIYFTSNKKPKPSFYKEYPRFSARGALGALLLTLGLGSTGCDFDCNPDRQQCIGNLHAPDMSDKAIARHPGIDQHIRNYYKAILNSYPDADPYNFRPICKRMFSGFGQPNLINHCHKVLQESTKQEIITNFLNELYVIPPLASKYPQLNNFVDNNNLLTETIKLVTDGTPSEYKEIKTIEIPLINLSETEMQEKITGIIDIANTQLNRVVKTDSTAISGSLNEREAWFWGAFDVPSRNFKASLRETTQRVVKSDRILVQVRLKNELSPEIKHELDTYISNFVRNYLKQWKDLNPPTMLEIIKTDPKIVEFQRMTVQRLKNEHVLPVSAMLRFFMRSKI